MRRKIEGEPYEGNKNILYNKYIIKTDRHSVNRAYASYLWFDKLTNNLTIIVKQLRPPF